MSDVVKLVGWAIVFLLVIISASFMAKVVLFPVRVANNVGTVANQIIDPKNMLDQYRWFHDADAQLKVMPAKIKAAKDNLEFAKTNAPDRASARMTELTGLTQACDELVGQYNSRAQRLDAGFFRNPEKVLPVATDPWEPLPSSYDTSICQGA